MALNFQLDPSVSQLAVALGIAKPAGSGLDLDPGFFSDPWSRVSRIFSDDTQRGALISALQGLLKSAEPHLAGPAGTGVQRNSYPLLETGKPGQVYLIVTRTGNAPGAPMRLSVRGEVQAANDGPAAWAELPLFGAENGTVELLAGAPDYPLRIEGSAPISAEGARIAVALVIVAPPNESKCRLNVRIDGLAAETAPVDFDLSGAAPPLAKIAALLLNLIFAEVGSTAPAPVLRMAEAFPALFGFLEGMPPLPLGELVKDAGAMRSWLAQLATARLPDSRSALVAWLEAIGRLIGAELPSPSPAGTEDDPVLLPLLTPGDSIPGIVLTAGLRSDPAGGASSLVLTMRTELSSSAVDAVLRAEAVLLVLPLSGSAPATVLERMDLLLRSPGSAGMLVDPAQTGGTLGVGALRAGLRYLAAAGAPTIVPLLELDTVTLTVNGKTTSFDRLDLTSTSTLSSAGETLLVNALEAGLGSTGTVGAAAARVVAAVRTLLGLGTSPGVDLSALPGAPTRAIAAYYRALRSATNGWQPILEALGHLLGNETPDVKGDGTSANPWAMKLDLFAPPPESPVELQLCLWDGGDVTTPRLMLALRAHAEGTTWSTNLAVQIVEAELSPSAPGAVRWLGGVTGNVDLAPPAFSPDPAGISVGMKSVHLGLTWAPGSQVQLKAQLEEIALTSGDTEIALGTISLPLASAPDLSKPDLGLGLDPDALWDTVRLLLSRCAGSWSGPAESALLALIGIVSPAAPGLTAMVPPLGGAGTDLAALLREPIAALRGWLGTLLADDAASLADAGQPCFDSLLDLAHALLTDRLPEVAAVFPPPEVPRYGNGTVDAPWALPLQPSGATPVEVTIWTEPYGPPASWFLPALNALDPEGLVAGTFLDAARATSAKLPWLGEVLRGCDLAEAARRLDALAGRLAGSDGLLPPDGSAPPAGWDTGSVVPAAHHLITRHPDAVAQVKDRIDQLTGGVPQSQWSVVLIAPRFAGAGCWGPLIDGVPAADQAAISLRTPGVVPKLADLNGVTAVAWYVVDLADDGDVSREDSAAALVRVVEAVRRAKPGSKVILVAHSYLGLVAEAYAAANQDLTLGLVTLAAPLGDPGLVATKDSEFAEALRLAVALSPGRLTAPGAPLDDTMRFLADLLEGRATGTGSTIPGQDLLRSELWQRGAAIAPGLGAVSALAVSGELTDDLIQLLATRLSLALSVDAAAVPPGELCFGVRLGLKLPEAAAGEVSIDARLGLKLGAIPLGMAEAAATPAWIDFRARIERPGGWLVGSAGDGTPQEARIRSAELVGLLIPGTGTPTVRFALLVHDVALRGVSSPVAGLDDPVTAELLDILVRTLDSAPPKGGAVDTFLDLLSLIGLIRRQSPELPAAVLADGLKGLRNDSAACLGARLPALFDRAEGLFGFLAPAGAPAHGGPWKLAFPDLPVECVVERDPWRVEFRTTGSGLPVGAVGKLRAAATVDFTKAESEMAASLELAGFSLTRETPSSPFLLTGSWLEQPVTLYPPGNPEAIARSLAPVIPRILINGAITLLLEQYFGGRARIASLDGLLRDAGAWLTRSGSLGENGIPRADLVNLLLKATADLAGLQSAPTTPLVLPGGVALAASDLGTGNQRGMRLALGTASPLVLWQMDGNDVTLDLDLRLDLDHQREATPGGTLVLHLPLPGGWQSLDLTLGADPAGLKLSVQTGSGVDLTLLPSLSGLDTLVSAAGNQLLPLILDELVKHFDADTPRPATLDDTLAVAGSLGIYDVSAAAGAGFRARGPELAKFVSDLASGNLQSLAPAIGSACATFLQRLFGTGVVPVPPAPGRIGLQLSDFLGTGSTIGIEADFSTKPVGVRLKAKDLEAGAVKAAVEVGLVGGGVVAALDLLASIDTGFGLVFTPRLAAALSLAGTPQLAVTFRPLGSDDVVITLAPAPAPLTVGDLVQLAESWIVPLGGTLLLRGLSGVLSNKLWPGAAKTIQDALIDAKIARLDPGGLSLATPLLTPAQLLNGLLDAVVGQDIPLPGTFTLAVAKENSLYGLALRGDQQFAIDDYSVTLRMGLPRTVDLGWGDAGRGVGMVVLDLADPNKPQLVPTLRLGGLGVVVGRKDTNANLVDAGGFRLRAAGGWLCANVALSGAGAPRIAGEVYGAVELTGLGLVIGSGDNSNAVASSLLKGDSGDKAPANPPFDLVVGTGPDGWAVSVSGKAEIRIVIRKNFGPLYIEEIDLFYRAEANPKTGPGSVGVGITGGISVSALTLQVEDLSLMIPLAHPSDLSKWRLDLAGLALSFQSSSVSLSGGLRKALLTLEDGAQVIDYEGALCVQVSGRSLSAVGAYAEVKDPASGSYTSFFAFLAINMPLGGPPYLYVIGLAGGIGYNRRLLTPRNPEAVGSFPLVSAMTGVCSDPMKQLTEIGTDIPPSHGAFWIAAGVRFSTFVLLQSTALLTVSADRGVEVTLLGLMQLQLPPSATVVSLELAISVKYSTIDQVLSLRAALTENSWLISKDCQLTGGFAFVIWFRGPTYSASQPASAGPPQVILSIGGYSKYFQVPDYYPVVPRVGFHWNVGSGIVVKGETFFTLTQSALMFGGALEASYDVSPIRIWFSADLDVMIMWDPFNYAASISVEIGAAFHYDIDVWIGTITINVSVTLGASVWLAGPPMHGEATVELLIATVTVPFGDTPQQQLYVDWPAVCIKYVEGGDPSGPDTPLPGTSCAVGAGAIAAADSRDGSEQKPWTVSSQFTLLVESKMPASGWRLNGANHGDDFGTASVDVVPCHPNFGKIRSVLVITLEPVDTSLGAVDAARLATSARPDHFPASVWDAAKVPPPDGVQASTGPAEMVRALGKVELGAGVRPVGGSGTDIPCASMVEDEPTALPLSFGPRPVGLVPRTARRRVRQQLPAATAVPVVPAAEPRLHAILGAPFQPVRPSRSVRSKAAGTKGGAPIGLPAGGGHAWLLAPGDEHRVRITGGAGAVRVTALGGTGGVLADHLAAQKQVLAPADSCRVVVTEAPRGEVSGWELTTPVLVAGPATALVPGATLHPPGPWTPPARYGKGLCWVPAALLTGSFDGTTTRFPLDQGSPPTVVILRLDRVSQSAAVEELSVQVTGGRLGKAGQVAQGSRVDLVFPVHPAMGAQFLALTVTTGANWRLAGVLASRRGARRWSSDLKKGPYLRFIDSVPPPAAASQPRISVQKVNKRATPATRKKP